MSYAKRSLAQLEDQEFDVLIIGGGITGAWLALHASRSGYRTALIEQQDFASQTSSSSSKLLHGGIRYLQQFQFGKVRESALERAHYIYAAPHLSHSVPFLIPTYRDFPRSKFFLRCGMMAYQFLTLGENRIIDDPDETLPGHSSISRSALQEVLDLGDEPHTGAVQFYERHMHNSERMVLSILRTAEQAGAVIANYCEAKKLNRDSGTVTGVEARDVLENAEFPIRSKLVINAAGPWIDELNTEANNKLPSINGFAIGSHLITRQISKHAIALATGHQSDTKLDRGGRHVFVIPWQGFSLIGTSYDEIDQPRRNLLPTVDDVKQLLDAVNSNVPTAKLTADDVISGYSGLYPLRTETIESSVYQGSGEYVIIDHAKSDQLEGLITALGAKFTTGRKLSALTMKAVQSKLGGQINLSKAKLHDSNYTALQPFLTEKQKQYGESYSPELVSHLARLYGSDIDAVLALAASKPELGRPITTSQPDVLAQVVFAIQNDHAVTLEDVLFRRLSVGFFGINQAEVEVVAKVMAPLLSWSEEQTDKQIDLVLSRLSTLRDTLSQVRDG